MIPCGGWDFELRKSHRSRRRLRLPRRRNFQSDVLNDHVRGRRGVLFLVLSQPCWPANRATAWGVLTDGPRPIRSGSCQWGSGHTHRYWIQTRPRRQQQGLPLRSAKRAIGGMFRNRYPTDRCPVRLEDDMTARRIGRTFGESAVLHNLNHFRVRSDDRLEIHGKHGTGDDNCNQRHHRQRLNKHSDFPRRAR